MLETNRAAPCTVSPSFVQHWTSFQVDGHCCGGRCWCCRHAGFAATTIHMPRLLQSVAALLPGGWLLGELRA